MLINICTQCNKKLATYGKLCGFCVEENNLEFEKCKSNPFYFVTKYLTVDGKKFTTQLLEEEFNKLFNELLKK